MKEKTLKSVLLFLLLSLILVTIFSVIYWFEYKNDLDSLEYIGDSDWKKPEKLVSELFTDNFSVITVDNEFKLFYIKKDINNLQEDLYINQYNLKGELNNKNKYKTAKSLNYFSVIKEGNFVHLFTIEGDKDSAQNLIYYKLDEKNETKSKKVLLNNISYTTSLVSHKYNNKFFIALTADKNNKNYIELVKFNPETDKIVNVSKVEFSKKEKRLGIRYPEFVFTNNKIYLSYLREDPSMLFTSTSDKTNKRELILEVLDFNFENIQNEKIIVDRAYKRDKSSKPEMIIDKDNLYIYYHHYNLDNSQTFMNKAVFSLKDDKTENIVAVDNNTIAAIDHLEKNDKHYLVYNKFKNIRSSIYLYETTKLTDNEPGNILFSQYQMSYNPKINANQDSLQIVWAEKNNNRNDIYFSTNNGKRKAGFWEILGLNVSGENSVFAIAPIYFLALPILSVIRNFHIIFFAGVVLILLYIMANKFNLSKFKNTLDNVYVSYITIMLSFGFISYLTTIPEYFFFPGVPLTRYIPFIFASAFLAVLLMLRRSEIDTEASPFLAIAGLTLWMYWVSQINLVFFLAHYFF